MKNKAYHNSVKHIWLVLAIMAIAAFIHKTYKTGSVKESFTFLIIFIISISIFLLRRKMGQKD